MAEFIIRHNNGCNLQISTKELVMSMGLPVSLLDDDDWVESRGFFYTLK
jgi:hypothetical protein